MCLCIPLMFMLASNYVLVTFFLFVYVHQTSKSLTILISSFYGKRNTIFSISSSMILLDGDFQVDFGQCNMSIWILFSVKEKGFLYIPLYIFILQHLWYFSKVSNMISGSTLDFWDIFRKLKKANNRVKMLWINLCWIEWLNSVA